MAKGSVKYTRLKKSSDPIVSVLQDKLDKFAEGKQHIEDKIVENDRWYKSQHWDITRLEDAADEPEPTTAYLFSTLANKHADIMDYFPVPNFTPREQSDEKEAQTLSKIVPVILRQNKFRRVYSNSAWYLLKQGFNATGVFWDTDTDDIKITRIDVLNMYWEPGISDIQDSSHLFIGTLEDNDVLERMYAKQGISLSGSDAHEIKQYISDDTIDISAKSIVWDCYVKKVNAEGKQVVHLIKFVNDTLLSNTETDPDLAETGLYDHGKFPVVMDVLFPEESTPIGFGYIDIIKNPQMYIDKLDQLISKNALVSGRVRYLVSEGLGIDPNDLADLSKDVITVQGGVREGENFMVMQGKPMAAFVANHRENKINEMKDISSTQDFSRGDTGGGVTAASAIAMLQEAGNKTSRDMIGSGYESYADMIEMVVELIRQFYTTEKKFRITNEQGDPEYVTYDNSGLQEQPVLDEMGIETGEYRKPVLDIDILAEKASPFTRAAHNELAKEMYGLGFFNPEMAPQSIIALGMMSFEGKEKVLKQISENGQMYEQIQMLTQQVQQLMEVTQGMNEYIKQTTGKDMTQLDGQAVPTL
jgi:hypothetical protein